MPRYKAQERNGLLVPVVLSEQLVPGSFAFALQYLVDTELDRSALDARYRNEMSGASAYDPRVLLKIVLLAYSQGIVSTDAYTCPAGKVLERKGKVYDVRRGRTRKDYRAETSDCTQCALRAQCLRKPGQQRRSLRVQSSAAFDPNHPGDRMRAAIDSPHGRRLYSQRMGTVEPVFANIRHNKRLNRFHLRGKTKVNTQWHLYCLVHNIEKLAKAGLGTEKNH